MNMPHNYRIDLKNMRSDAVEYQFHLDNAFFEAIGDVLIQKGSVDVILRVKKTAGAFELTFCIKGVVQIPCDRCLDDMDQSVDSVSVLKVKFGDEYADEGELIVVPYEDGVLDVAWNIYEFIALEIPIKHVHEPGKCNGAMMSVLEQHTAKSFDEELENDSSEDIACGEPDGSERPTDPRWSELKKILDNKLNS